MRAVPVSTNLDDFAKDIERSNRVKLHAPLRWLNNPAKSPAKKCGSVILEIVREDVASAAPKRLFAAARSFRVSVL